MSLTIAQQSITAAAEHHRRLSNQCAALAGMIQAIKPPKDEPMPVEGLAKALLTLAQPSLLDKEQRQQSLPNT